jgi:hypothetical protein
MELIPVRVGGFSREFELSSNRYADSGSNRRVERYRSSVLELDTMDGPSFGDGTFRPTADWFDQHRVNPGASILR